MYIYIYISRLIAAPVLIGTCVDNLNWHMLVQNYWEYTTDRNGNVVSAGPEACLLGCTVLPDGEAQTKAATNLRILEETGCPLKRQRTQVTDNTTSAVLEKELNDPKHDDPDVFDHIGCDPHRMQLPLKKGVHGLNGTKGGMHDFGVENLLYKLWYLPHSDPIAHKQYLYDSAMEVYDGDFDKVRQVMPIHRALIDKWEECVEPLTMLLDHWDVYLHMAKKLGVSKGKGGLMYSRNFRCPEWAVVAGWMGCLVL